MTFCDAWPCALKAARAYDEIAGALGRPVNGVPWSDVVQVLRARNASRHSFNRGQQRKADRLQRKAALYDKHIQQKKAGRRDEHIQKEKAALYDKHIQNAQKRRSRGTQTLTEKPKKSITKTKKVAERSARP